MNIETTSVNLNNSKKSASNAPANTQEGVNFKEELSELKQAEEKKEQAEIEDVEVEKDNKPIETSEKEATSTSTTTQENLLNNAVNGLNSILEELNQSEDKLTGFIKKEEVLSDNHEVINKDFNIQENKDILPQMNPNMNFGGDGQPFSSFMNNKDENNREVLKSSAKELVEEAAILSTMAENIAIANKNKIITNNQGIKKVDKESGITVENIVKFDTVIMNEADVEIFTQLVQNKEVDLNKFTSENIAKSTTVSKTLADLLAKSMNNNQPIRIDFDNDISVIIKISRDGKISADFLPSSQIAETYLRENLPLLRQKFEDNDIKYDELNQRERKDQNKENNRKKGRNDE